MFEFKYNLLQKIKIFPLVSNTLIPMFWLISEAALEAFFHECLHGVTLKSIVNIAAPNHLHYRVSSSALFSAYDTVQLSVFSELK